MGSPRIILKRDAAYWEISELSTRKRQEWLNEDFYGETFMVKSIGVSKMGLSEKYTCYKVTDQLRNVHKYATADGRLLDMKEKLTTGISEWAFLLYGLARKLPSFMYIHRSK